MTNRLITTSLATMLLLTSTTTAFGTTPQGTNPNSNTIQNQQNTMPVNIEQARKNLEEAKQTKEKADQNLQEKKQAEQTAKKEAEKTAQTLKDAEGKAKQASQNLEEAYKKFDDAQSSQAITDMYTKAWEKAKETEPLLKEAEKEHYKAVDKANNARTTYSDAKKLDEKIEKLLEAEQADELQTQAFEKAQKLGEQIEETKKAKEKAQAQKDQVAMAKQKYEEAKQTEENIKELETKLAKAKVIENKIENLRQESLTIDVEGTKEEYKKVKAKEQELKQAYEDAKRAWELTGSTPNGGLFDEKNKTEKEYNDYKQTVELATKKNEIALQTQEKLKNAIAEKAQLGDSADGIQEKITAARKTLESPNSSAELKEKYESLKAMHGDYAQLEAKLSQLEKEKEEAEQDMLKYTKLANTFSEEKLRELQAQAEKMGNINDIETLKEELEAAEKEEKEKLGEKQRLENILKNGTSDELLAKLARLNKESIGKDSDKIAEETKELAKQVAEITKTYEEAKAMHEKAEEKAAMATKEKEKAQQAVTEAESNLEKAEMAVKTAEEKLKEPQPNSPLPNLQTQPMPKHENNKMMAPSEMKPMGMKPMVKGEMKPSEMKPMVKGEMKPMRTAHAKPVLKKTGLANTGTSSNALGLSILTLLTGAGLLGASRYTARHRKSK